MLRRQPAIPEPTGVNDRMRVLPAEEIFRDGVSRVLIVQRHYRKGFAPRGFVRVLVVKEAYFARGKIQLDAVVFQNVYAENAHDGTVPGR